MHTLYITAVVVVEIGVCIIASVPVPLLRAPVSFFHQAATLRAFLRKLFAATLTICWGLPIILCIVAISFNIQGFGDQELWYPTLIRHNKLFFTLLIRVYPLGAGLMTSTTVDSQLHTIHLEI